MKRIRPLLGTKESEVLSRNSRQLWLLRTVSEFHAYQENGFSSNRGTLLKEEKKKVRRREVDGLGKKEDRTHSAQ